MRSVRTTLDLVPWKALAIAALLAATPSMARAGTDEPPPPPDACTADAGHTLYGPDAGGGYVFSDPVAAPVVRWEPACSASHGAHGAALVSVSLVGLALVCFGRRRAMRQRSTV